MIYEDIQIKKIILQNCLYEMGKRIALIYNPKDYTGRSNEELFTESLDLVFTKSYLADRISVTIENINFLFNLGIIDEKKMMQLKDSMLMSLDSVQYYEEEKNKFIEESSKLFLSDDRFELLRFISNSEELQKKLLSIYENFAYKEDEIADIVMNVWDFELTDFSSYSSGEPYKYLVYATKMSANEVYKQLFYKPIIYTSLITNQHTTTYHLRGYGLVYIPKKENLLFMSNEDNYVVDSSIQADSLRFSILSNYMMNREGIVKIQHMDRHASRTFLIDQLLSDTYNEITLINNQHSYPCAVFKFNNCDEWEEANANELSEKLNIKLITLNR